MPIALDQGGSAAPGLKLKNHGDYAVVRLCHQEVRDAIEFGTKKPKLKDNGKPKKQLVLTGIYMDGTACITTGPKGARVDEDPEKGGEVRLYIEGHKFGAWIEAKNASKPNVGDVVKITYTRDEPSSGGGQDKKVWEFKIRPFRIEDEKVDVAKAENIFHRIAKDGLKSDDSGAGEDIPF